MSFTNIAVIYNPNSTGSSGAMAEAFEKKLRAKLPKQRVSLIATEYAGHAEKLAYRIGTESKNPLIISSSGDGGYNEVVNGAMQAQNEGHKVTTGVLPAGNANDHYHNLHKARLVNQIIDNKIQKLDLLRITGRAGGKKIQRYAHSYIGFGLTPIIGNELNKTKLTATKEIWLVARELLRVKHVRLQIHGNEHDYESIIFSNIDRMSKFLKISQPSSVSDGKFEVTIFRRRGKLRLLLILLRASVSGVREDSQVSEFSLKTVQKTLVQTDGEIIQLDARSKVTIDIEPSTLRYIL